MLKNKTIIIGISPGFAGSRSKSKSVQRVKNWMSICGINESQYDWRNLVDIPGQNPKMSEVELKHAEISGYDKVICLGNKPEQWCNSHQIEHIKVPHPSGLNRKWNVPGQEITTIESIKEFLAK
jgi:hypothetical protein